MLVRECQNLRINKARQRFAIIRCNEKKVLMLVANYPSYLIQWFAIKLCAALKPGLYLSREMSVDKDIKIRVVNIFSIKFQDYCV